ncbi:hypothetical protein [Mycobacterium sp. 852002-40037_SCH5390672]|uniref:hypothetical protein n=1 Tax=Mycobacterium sp. 852002-40037_SCH5390672 TaxID=1834089 RepID=UPI0012E7F7B7|nr:hypothetical protein [Mycobacterium sp. 852002-40037_SCH5390672]
MVLRQWKAEAEERARHMVTAGLGSLSVPLDLAIPTTDALDSLLSFANTRVQCVGRADELNELNAFLDAEMPFSWWLWTGPAGIGKSRLAVELCRLASPAWHAGFLGEEYESELDDVVTMRPTLLIVDYASERSTWLSEVLVRFSRRKTGSKVRVLILERQAAGLWWETVQRHHRMSESSQVAATMYAFPHELGGVSRDDARELIKITASELGHQDLTTTQIEDIADKAQSMDPGGGPLFIQIATMDWLDAHGASGGRDEAIRRLLDRSQTGLNLRLEDPSLVPLVRNVQIFATVLGGLSVEEYAELAQVSEIPNGLLPNVFRSLGSVSLDDLLDGVRPDILGELLVLDQLGASETARHASMSLLHYACLAKPDAYQGFLARAAADHTEHPRLIDLLEATIYDESPLISIELGVSIIALLGRSNHEAVNWVFERLQAVQHAEGQDATARLLTSARYSHANLVLRENNTQRACELYTDALTHCDPAWPEYGSILNNRGISFLQLDRSQDAVADFTAVIDSTTASDEARACALNNRADVLFDADDVRGAIADRSAVLALDDTTYNRRYIALTRRADARRQLGDNAGAYTDIETILATHDIAVEQKMAARLKRAQWHIGAGEMAAAQPDLDAIVTSRRNFPEVVETARRLRQP